MAKPSLLPAGIALQADIPAAYATILTPPALEFITSLARTFQATRAKLLLRRAERQREFDRGVKPDFLAETRSVRASEWTVAAVPQELADRRVEITGPVERKMIINALNSGANIFLADFEDSLTPTWDNLIQGQINLRDAVNRTIRYDSPEGKHYRLNKKTAILFVRPRAWHLVEKHVLVDGEPVAASLFDFGLYFFHNTQPLRDRGTAPYFYLPKMESHLEARLWNEVFVWAQDQLGIPRGTIKATVLIETILAAFEMDEILYELREHSAGLTETGLRLNIEVGISYLGAWLAGTGCVPIHHFMEDAATAEISRTQVWHWVRSKKGILSDGRKITLELVRTLIPEELQRIQTTLGETLYAAGKYPLAANLFDKLVSTEPLPEFLTLFAYDRLD